MHEDPQQGCLAGTVIADEGGFFAVFYMETGVFEDNLFAKCFTYVLT